MLYQTAAKNHRWADLETTAWRFLHFAGLPAAVLRCRTLSSLYRRFGLELTLEQVKAHLGDTQPTGDSQRHRYIAHDVKLDQIPVSQMMFDLDQAAGLRSLADEFNVDDMTEVLASLRVSHGQPLTTSIEDRRYTEQLWVWNTGDDLITALKSDTANRQQFLISYRPSRLRPEML